MIKAVIVGIGSLGSTLAEEICKRAVSQDMELSIELIDNDVVEDRNVVAQNFSPIDIGKYKVDAIAEKIKNYPGIEITTKKMLVTTDNVNDLDLTGPTMIIDCVDNVPTRRLLALKGLTSNKPVMHCAMSLDGFGSITWNYKTHDTFPLSNKNLTVEGIESAEEKEKEFLEKARNKEEFKEISTVPPCELTSYRGLIINTVLAANDAFYNFVGKDPTNRWKDSDFFREGFVTKYDTTLTSYEPKVSKFNTALMDTEDWK